MTKAFERAGTYEASLTATDGAGNASVIPWRVEVAPVQATSAPAEPSGDAGTAAAPNPGPRTAPLATPLLDRTPPAFAGLALSSKRLVAAGRRPRGTTLRWRLAEPALVTVAVETRRGRRLGVLRRRAAAGPGALAFSGRVKGRALRPGRYRLAVAARDAAGNASAPRRLAFTVVRR